MTPTSPEQASEEPVARIDREEFEKAQRNPWTQFFWAEADAYAKKLIDSGHCRCHLVVNCPDAVERDEDGRPICKRCGQTEIHCDCEGEWT